MQPGMLGNLTIDMRTGHNDGSQYQDSQQHQFSIMPGSADASFLTPSSFTESIDDPAQSSAAMLNEDPILDIDDSSLAEFFQDIMTRGSPNYSKEDTAMDLVPQDSSWDVLNFGIDSSLDFNDMDLGWITSHNETSILSYNFLPDYGDLQLDHGQQTPDVHPSINLGAEAFRKSLWNWLPGQREHAFMEVSNLSLSHKDMEGFENRASPDIIDPQLEQSSRDDILAMVLSTNSQQNGASRVITSFPSTQLLNSLMHLFLRSEATKTDSFIHLPTFRPRTQRPEFNGIIIAAGAILSSVPTGMTPFLCLLFGTLTLLVRKLGFAIQETVRLAIPATVSPLKHREEIPTKLNQVEKDNSRSRELQVMQAFALELQIGLWSGNKRKMEIAEAHAQPLITVSHTPTYFEVDLIFIDVETIWSL
jgi:hypothetical protein